MVIIASCTGCAVGPDYVPPQTTVPKQFMGSTVQGISSEQVLERWWSNFSDQQLNKLVSSAVHSNIDLRAAIARVNQARAIRQETFLDLFPTVGSDVVYTRNRTPTSTFAGGAIQNGNNYINNEYYNAGFDAFWELDIFGRVRRSVEVKDAESEASVAELHDAIRILVSEVARNYFELRGTQQQISVSNENAVTQEQVVRVATALFKGGQSTEFDLLRAQAQHSNTLATIPPLKARAKAAVYRLAVLCGKQPQELVLDEAHTFPVYVGPVTLGDPAGLLQRRPDIRAVERQLGAATAGIGVARGDLFPKVTFMGSVGFQANTVRELSSGNNETYGIGPSISWPALNIGRVFANIDQSEAVQQQVIARYEQTVLLALEETERALVQFSASRQRRDYLKDAVDYSSKAVAIAQTQYENGLIDLLPVLDAQRSALTSQLQLAESETELLTALVALFKALGGGWDEAIAEVKLVEQTAS